MLHRMYYGNMREFEVGYRDLSAGYNRVINIYN